MGAFGFDNDDDPVMDPSDQDGQNNQGDDAGGADDSSGGAKITVKKSADDKDGVEIDQSAKVARDADGNLIAITIDPDTGEEVQTIVYSDYDDSQGPLYLEFGDDGENNSVSPVTRAQVNQIVAQGGTFKDLMALIPDKVETDEGDEKSFSTLPGLPDDPLNNGPNNNSNQGPPDNTSSNVNILPNSNSPDGGSSGPPGSLIEQQNDDEEDDQEPPENVPPTGVDDTNSLAVTSGDVELSGEVENGEGNGGEEQGPPEEVYYYIATGNVLDNDFDPDSSPDPIFVTEVRSDSGGAVSVDEEVDIDGEFGTLTISPDGSYSYVFEGGFDEGDLDDFLSAIVDEFEYDLSDGEDLASPAPVLSIRVVNNALDVDDLAAGQGFITAGAAVGGGSDVNHDGLKDVVTGDPFFDVTQTTSEGRTYVTFGFPTPSEPVVLIDEDFGGENGLIFNGIDSHDNSGRSVDLIGDFNGDGRDDILIGAPLGDGFASESGGENSYEESPYYHGEAYIIYSFEDLLDDGIFDLGDLSSPIDNPGGALGVTIFGAAGGDYTGFSVSHAGDINGDGLQDVIIGAPEGYFYFEYDCDGKAYVLFGSAGLGNTVDLASDLSAGVGFSMDGLDDLAIGFSVSGAGDVNGDGFDDIIVGTYSKYNSYDQYYEMPSPQVFVIFGGDNLPDNIDLSTLDPSQGFEIDGITLPPESYHTTTHAYSVSGAGDFNGDGFDDLIIGNGAFSQAREYDGYTYYSYGQGRAFIVFGGENEVFSSGVDLASLDGDNGFSIERETSEHGAGLGYSVSDAGDVNGDGFADVIVGLPNVYSGAGQAVVLFGGEGAFSPSLNLGALTLEQGFFVNGPDYGDEFGVTVSAAGDTNGDGFDDVIIGHFNDEDFESYVIYGFDSHAITTGAPAPDVTVAGTGGEDDIVTGVGNDTVMNVGVGDSVRTGAGDDVIFLTSTGFFGIDGGNGLDRLVLQNDIDLDLAELLDNRIKGIEEIDLLSGDSQVDLKLTDVINLTDGYLELDGDGGTHLLRIRGDEGDVVNFETPESWFKSGVDGGFDVYKPIGGELATVLLQQGIDANIPEIIT